ncbi:response regulator [Parvibaculum sedimenti]|uniref:Response regulator n=1 Tax=Parvibaculum sedimenti TaxID=2608632 RepID=A0A6N6VHT9_9HYPH|nr:response regulator [Parvibaculum sedimenti]KAB7739538.1 response regulator [Parvibaculum sedimenti]
MTVPIHILVVDDEPQIRRFLRTSLGAQGYRLSEASNAADAASIAEKDKPDLVILDLGLPDGEGFGVIEQLRLSSQVPIVILSVRNDEQGKVRALDLGADDYVTKPFGMEELMARIRTALRHRLQVQGEAPLFRSGALSVDLVRRVVTVADNEVKLSAKEYDLLRILIAHAGKVLTHGFLLKEVWGPAHAEDVQYLRVYIRQLREKLEADPTRPQLILTETGVGYRLRLD